MNEAEQGIIIARLDERTKFMAETIQRVEHKVDTFYVTRDEHAGLRAEFESELAPLKKLVYSSLIGVILALVGMVASQLHLPMMSK